MGAVKIVKFLGEAPKLATEHLPESAAAFAYNIKLYSGDMIPYNEPTDLAAFAKSGEIKSIFPMDDGSGGFKWLHWTTDVDVVKSPVASTDAQRIYYTGDSEPRVTNYSLATTGASLAYPLAHYTLGLPAPVTAPTVSATSFAALTSATRARDSGNIATVTFASAHNLINGAYVTTTTFGGTGYNLTNAQITVVDATTITFYSPGAAETSTADTAGRVNLAGPTQIRNYVYTWVTAWGEESVPSPVSTTLYMKEGQSVSVTGLPSAWPGSYSGTFQTSGMQVRLYRTVTSASGSSYYKVADVNLGTTSYTDTIASSTLTTVLPSTYYDQPVSTMKGLQAVHNGILIGFYDNQLCFSEPGQPHAWPARYRMAFDANIVGVENVGQSIIVLTDENPWVVQGNAPSLMSKTRMDFKLPCISKRGVVNMGYGLVFPSKGGLALYSTSTGGDFATKHIEDWDTWANEIDQTTFVAGYYNGKYIASSSKGSFIFEKHDQIGGFFIRLSQSFTAFHYDQDTAILYFAYNGHLYKWDDSTKPLGQFDWKSKTMVTKDYMNLGAARVIADYGSDPNDILIAQQNAVILSNNLAMINARATGGAIAEASFGTVAVASDLIQTPLSYTGGVQFQLFVDKELLFTTQVADNAIFRLPAGYRSDTFEVRLTGNTRIRAVHLAETPNGLDKV